MLRRTANEDRKLIDSRLSKADEAKTRKKKTHRQNDLL